MKIGEAAKSVGLATSTLRYYEELGLIEKPPRVSNQRSFSPEIVDRLRFIKQASGLNFSLGEIKTYIDGLAKMDPHSSTWQEFAGDKIGKLESQISDLQEVLATLKQSMSCGCTDATTCGESLP